MYDFLSHWVWIEKIFCIVRLPVLTVLSAYRNLFGIEPINYGKMYFDKMNKMKSLCF